MSAPQESDLSWEALDAALPTELGVFPGMAVTGRYVLGHGLHAHAGTGLKAMSLPDGHVAVAVVDTGRRGPAAALVAARVLAVLRGQVECGASLHDAMTAVDRYAGQSPGAAGATLTAAVIAPSGDAEVAAAGHPPALHLRANADIGVLDLAPSRPLGTGGHAAAQTLRVADGEALLLPSDGLLTARDGGVSDGIGRLCGAVESSTPRDGQLPTFGDTLGDAVLAAMQHPHGYLDDAALLVAHRLPAPGPFQGSIALGEDAGGTGGEVPEETLSAFDTWLARLGIGPVDHLGLLQAVRQLLDVLSPAVRSAHLASRHRDHGWAPSVEVVAELGPEAQIGVRLCVPIPWVPEAPAARRALVIAGGVVSSLTLVRHDGTTEVRLRQRVGRPVPILRSNLIRGEGQIETSASEELVPRTRVVDVREGLLRLAGGMRAEEAAGIREAVHAATCSGTVATTIDLAQVDRVSGPALHILLDYFDRAQASGTELVICTVARSAADQMLTRAGLPHRVW